MAEQTQREHARDPQDLERLLVPRQRTGDVDGMVALYEPDAVIDCGGGHLVRGSVAIRAYFADLVAQGRKFDFGEQRPAVISGGLALTSTRFPDGSISSEIARRQGNGSWLWVVDRFAVV